MNATSSRLSRALPLIAPGTELRDGLDRILHHGTTLEDAFETAPQGLDPRDRALAYRIVAARQKAAVVSAGGRAVPMADLLAEDFRDAPDRMFSFDRYHPSADGYGLAADILLPEVLAALGEWGPEPLPEPPEVSPSVDNSKLTERILRIARTVR